ncbi:MAG: single-stranded-DNA-specific exonuclease RecJ [Acidobacteriaceae bacterium]
MNPTADTLTSDNPKALSRWTFPSIDAAAAAELAHTANFPLLVAELLLARGISTVQDAEIFLAPAIEQLHDPYLMLGMMAAVTRIQEAIARNEIILIYGDYDVDGTTATVLLKTAIERVTTLTGSSTQVRYHVPHRIREGYGMQSSVLADAHTDGVRLVISVDTGIRAFAAADEAQRLGLDLIVTDHHLPDEQGIPQALAVLNPNQPGCPYPCKHLCGAGVAFKLVQALLDHYESEATRARILPSFLKLLAIATIADAVPLLDENRVITSIGLRELRRPVQPGLRALMQLAQLDPAKHFTATDIAFRLAPRINAAGRMDVASDVVELFTTREPQRAQELAEKLHRLNEERRATEAAALESIETRLAAEPELADASCYVLDDADCAESWHRGVVGILASRVVDRTHRPALVLTHEVDEQGQSHAHGSGRSVSGFHLLDAITSCADLFTRFGGHAHAVGFSLPSERVPELRQRLQAYASDHLTADMLLPEIVCDAELPLDRITPALYSWLKRFEPLGMGNADPVFIARSVRISAPIRMMKERHIRLRLSQGPRGTQFNALGWNWAEKVAALQLAEGSLIDIAYRLNENTHPDFGGLELSIVDIHAIADSL